MHAQADLGAVIVNCFKELNQTVSSRIGATAVGLEKINNSLLRLIAIEETKQNNERRSKLKQAVAAATGASDVAGTMVS